MKPTVALATSPSHLDHIAPVAACLGAPVLVDAPELLEEARRCYPDLDVSLADDPARDPLDGIEVVIHSIRVTRAQVQAAFPDPRVRVVCCPHGWSDKAWWLKWMPLEDVFLSYGEETDAMFDREGTRAYQSDCVVMGDLRYRYYRAHAAWFDAIAERDVFAELAPGRRTVLYAPTWADVEHAPALFESIEAMLRHLPAGYNLVIKPHPITVSAVRARLEALALDRRRVAVVTDLPLVFPILARADVYIGDRSSVGYDFLHFDRPLVFLRAPSWRPQGEDVLGRCGRELSLEDPAQLGAVLARLEEPDPQAAAARRDLRRRAFAPVEAGAFRDAFWQVCARDRRDEPLEPPAAFRAMLAELARVGGPLQRTTARRWCRFYPWRSELTR